jgi:pimeloyl-ACP methyl ester carboxylesterase
MGAADLRSSSSRIRIGDVTIHVDDWGGSGETLLFAHPTGFLGAVWLPVIRRLRAAGFDGRIYTFDQRGHGLSSKPDEGYQWRHFIDDVRALAASLDLEGAIGIGHSAGATTLAGVAAEDPQRLRRLLLIDPILIEPAGHESGKANPMSMRTRTRRLVWSSREELFESFRSRPPYDTWGEEALRAYVDHGTFERPDGEIELLCPGRIEAQVYQNAASVDGYALLRTLSIPVLLVRGERSDSFSAERASRALACLQNGRLMTIENATHFVPMELPDLTASLVLSELRG